MTTDKLKVTFTVLVALMVLVGFGALVYGYISTNNQLREEKRELCEVYCNCSITHNCIYTFDYSEVKNCECEK